MSEQAAKAESDVRRALGLLAREVEGRAAQGSLDSCEGRVSALEATAGRLEEQSGVALDFVDWFSRRGESFEYNAASIERHMNALAGGNVAAFRSGREHVGLSQPQSQSRGTRVPVPLRAGGVGSMAALGGSPVDASRGGRGT